MIESKGGKQAGETGERGDGVNTDRRHVPDRVAVLHRLLKLTNRLLAPFTAHVAKKHHISLNEFRMLMTLGRWGDQASHELAESTGVSAMSVSRAVSALEHNGRISVMVDPENRRRKRLSLTAQGRELFETMEPQSDAVADFLFHRLSAADLAALDRIVDALIDTLEEVDEQGHSRFVEETRL